MPAVTPVTSPVDTPMVATGVVPLVQVPPMLRSLSRVVAPIHTDKVPVMFTGSGFTVTTLVTKQPTPTV